MEKEKINEKEMITEGTVIQQRNGRYWAYVEYNGHQVLMNEEEYYPLRAINEDLTHSISFERDIVAIWEVNACNPLRAIEFVKMDAYCKQVYKRRTMKKGHEIIMPLNEWETLYIKEKIENDFDKDEKAQRLYDKIDLMHYHMLYGLKREEDGCDEN